MNRGLTLIVADFAAAFIVGPSPTPRSPLPRRGLAGLRLRPGDPIGAGAIIARSFIQSFAAWITSASRTTRPQRPVHPDARLGHLGGGHPARALPRRHQPHAAAPAGRTAGGLMTAPGGTPSPPSTCSSAPGRSGSRRRRAAGRGPHGPGGGCRTGRRNHRPHVPHRTRASSPPERPRSAAGRWPRRPARRRLARSTWPTCARWCPASGLNVRTFTRVVAIDRTPDANGTPGDFTVRLLDNWVGPAPSPARRSSSPPGAPMHRECWGAGRGPPGVHHELGDPHRFFGREVAVVGGRNSAAETALRLYRVGRGST